jgi:hypothetical protein
MGLDDFPGGHLHISSLQFEEDNQFEEGMNVEITDPNITSEREATTNQTIELVKAAAQAI